MRTCIKCGVAKPATAEHFQRRGEGFRGSCRACTSDYGKQWRLDNVDYQRQWRGSRPNYSIEYQRANRDDVRRNSKAWKQRNPEKLRASDRAVKRRKQKRDPASFRARAASYRARKCKADGSFTKSDIARLMKAQRNQCWWCSSMLREYHVDHRIPLARGGTNRPDNLVLACPPCNLTKHSKMPWEMRQNARLL